MHLHEFAGKHHSLLPNNLVSAWHVMQCTRCKCGASMHRIKRIPTQDVTIRSVGSCSNKNLFYSRAAAAAVAIIIVKQTCICMYCIHICQTQACTLWSAHLSDASSLLSFPLICTGIWVHPTPDPTDRQITRIEPESLCGSYLLP